MVANETKDGLYALALQKEEKYKEYGFGSDETDSPLPHTFPLGFVSLLFRSTSGMNDLVYLRVSYGDKPSFRFSKWLNQCESEAASLRLLDSLTALKDLIYAFKKDRHFVFDALTKARYFCVILWERLGKAAVLNVESSSFSWDKLSSLHHTEHSCSNDSEDDKNKELEARVIHNCNSEWLKIKEAAEKARGSRC
ncbi:hypothetical protein L6452_09037 [Arctium lappa]|uniref:Uncharacterized protein n=1 Tax=Arctium lappa TaxID=4217 RepID=A0ACB9DJD2_ARCLA|nr:hypothetical protein L6452_09037 [Arctium lappa]